MKSNPNKALNDSQSLLAKIEESLAINTRRTDIQDYLFDFYQGRWSLVYGEESDDPRCWNCVQHLQSELSPLGLCEGCFESNPCEYADEEHFDDSWENNEFKYLIDHGKDRTVWDVEYKWQHSDSLANKIFWAAIIVEIVVDGIIYTQANCGSNHSLYMANFKDVIDEEEETE